MGLGKYGLRQMHCIILMENVPEGIHTVTLILFRVESWFKIESHLKANIHTGRFSIANPRFFVANNKK